MFKFKMLTKVLVAVFFYGIIIELNLNLCIALSIDLSSPTHQVEPNKARSSSVAEHNAELEMELANDDQARVLDTTFASRTVKSASATSTITTTTTATNNSLAPANPTKGRPQGTSRTLSGLPARDGQPRALIQRLESNGRSNYFGKLLVGEQQLPFMVLFDLTSTNFWLPSSECTMNLCLGRQKYNRSTSATFKADEANRRLAVAYDRGLVLEGPISRDSVTFAGVTIEAQPFGEITNLEGDLLSMLPVDGFMGLGFKDMRLGASNSSADEPPMTPFERLWSLGLLKEPIFSLKIKADIQQYMYSANNGELILGEISREYSASEFTYMPVTHADFWEFRLSGVVLRSSYAGHDIERACESACPAILDTRYAFIGGHYSDVDRINKAMGAFPVGNGIYRMSQCDLGALPYLVFQIGGTEFILAPEEYVDVRRIRGAIHSCYSALVVVESSQYPFWILGEFFLKRHYIVFDYGQKRIGFARSKAMTQELVEDVYGNIKKVQGRSTF